MSVAGTYVTHARRLPSSEKTIGESTWLHPTSVPSTIPVVGSYSLTVLSYKADASSLLSSEKAIDLMLLVYPTNVCCFIPVVGSYIFAVLSKTKADASS